MFGLLRTTLALMVVISHLWLRGSHFGTYAVFSFYVISGYLMTLIMAESYGHTPSGRRAFVINRFLRLYPQYWAACLLSILLILLLGADAARLHHGNLIIPRTATHIVEHVLMLFVAWIPPTDYYPRLSPSTWALTVEIFFYALICLGLSKSARRVSVWLGLSLGYVAITYVIGLDWQHRYFPIFAASLPFSIGALIFHLPRRADFAPYARPLFWLLMANGLLWFVIPANDFAFYTNLAIAALLIYAIACGGNPTRLSMRTDKAVGDYSYPIYLVHWQAGLIATTILSLSFGPSVMILGAIIAIALSAIFIRLIDQPVQRIRSVVRPGRSAKNRPIESDSAALKTAQSVLL